MSKKERTILFLVCLFLFLLTAPLIILYSQGYRFDFNPPAGRIKITQTGGLGIKTEPKQAEIYIDGKLVKKTDFIFGSALIENLLPKKYKIEVKKKGYLTWEKNLEIKEKEVTEAKNIILFPEKINLTALTFFQENNLIIKNFWISPDEKKMILLEKEEQKDWALKVYDLERNIKSHLISEADVYKGGADLLNVEFSEDSKEIYLDTEIAEVSKNKTLEKQKKIFTLKLDKLPSTLTEKKIIPPHENVITSKKHNQDVYYLDNAGYLFKNDLKMNEVPFPIKPETKYLLEVFSNFVFLITENQTLYWFSPESKSFEIFFERINDLKISPDNKKLTFFSNSEIWILFLNEQGIKKAGEKLFLSRFSEKIDNVFWLNSDYLIFKSGGNLKIAEIDERDRIQTWDIVTLPNLNATTKIYFDKDNKKLYILNEGNLFFSEKFY